MCVTSCPIHFSASFVDFKKMKWNIGVVSQFENKSTDFDKLLYWWSLYKFVESHVCPSVWDAISSIAWARGRIFKIRHGRRLLNLSGNSDIQRYWLKVVYVGYTWIVSYIPQIADQTISNLDKLLLTNMTIAGQRLGIHVLANTQHRSCILCAPCYN
jgi:hypothetical protein